MRPKVTAPSTATAATHTPFISGCVYHNLEFAGGDLDVGEASAEYDACKRACEDHRECSFFTLTDEEGCRLKSEGVRVEERAGAVSGMTDDACGRR